MQLGVAKESIKQTLISSGWPEADIADAYNTIAGPSAAPSQPATQPSVSHPVTSDIFQPKTDPQPARKDPAISGVSANSFQTKMDSFSPAQEKFIAGTEGRSWKSFILPTILILAVIGLGVGLWMAYSQNTTLNDDISKKSLSNDDLTRQLAAATQEKSNLNSDVTKLNEDLADANNNLALFVPTASSTPVAVTLKGELKGDDKTSYTLKTSRDLTVAIKNYKAANVNGLLKPVLGTGVTLTGTTVPGSRELTVTAVNGTTVPEETIAPAASTTKATSDKPIMP